MLSIHPLVVLNIADHYNRFSSQRSPLDKVRGVIIGNHCGKNGQEYELVNSFEMPIACDPGDGGLDAQFVLRKHYQYQQVFKNQEILAWYIVGSAVDESWTRLHAQLSQIADSSVFLIVFDAFALRGGDESQKLPITAYEHTPTSTPPFTQVAFRLQTEEAEHVALASTTGPGSFGGVAASSIQPFLAGQTRALEMLHKRLATIKSFLLSVAEGKQELDRALLRRIQAVVCSLPIFDQSSPVQALLQLERDSSLLTTQLSLIFEGLTVLESAVSKHNALDQVRLQQFRTLKKGISSSSSLNSCLLDEY